MQNPTRIIFDCDGVLLDSNPMKIAAFKQALDAYPAAAVAEFSAYQARNFGRSRYVLFKVFFEFLGRPAYAGEVEMLVARYAELVRSAYLEVPLTIGCLAALKGLSQYLPLYVASGSDQDELRSVFRQRSLASYFQGIYGSPQSKIEILANLAKFYGGRALFIGDAQADLEAAQHYGWCDFVYMRPYAAAKEEMDGLAKQANIPIINQLPELLAMLAVRTIDTY